MARALPAAEQMQGPRPEMSAAAVRAGTRCRLIAPLGNCSEHQQRLYPLAITVQSSGFALQYSAHFSIIFSPNSSTLILVDYENEEKGKGVFFFLSSEE